MLKTTHYSHLFQHLSQPVSNLILIEFKQCNKEKRDFPCCLYERITRIQDTAYRSLPLRGSTERAIVFPYYNHLYLSHSNNEESKDIPDH